MRRYWIISIFIILSIVQYTVSVSMPKYVPEAYSGYVFIDNKPAPNGTIITVEGVNSKKICCKSIVVDNSGLYSLDLLIYDPDFSQLHGVDNHEPVIWKVNGIIASIPEPGKDTAESGEVNPNFNISALSSGSSASKENTYLSITIILVVIIALLVFYRTKK